MLFEHSAQVSKINGCHFFDQDIIELSYLYDGDIQLHANIDYKSPGFGFVITPLEGSSYLFKIGDNSYSIYQKDKEQYRIAYSTVQFGDVLKEGMLHLKIEKGEAFFYIENNGKTIHLNESTKLNIKSDTKYRIGIYSEANNTVRKFTILNGLPQGWNPNIVNTVGGRIRYEDNEIHFENCTYYGETETDWIKLKAGKYYLKYIKEGDIASKVFISGDKKIIEEEKDILSGDRFVLEEDKFVLICFYGKDGVVKNIEIKKYLNSAYLPSEGSGAKKDPSYLDIDLNEIESIKIDVEITEDLIPEESFFAIYGEDKFAPVDVPIKKKFTITFNKGTLTLNYGEDKNIFFNEKLPHLKLLYNIEAIISKMEITKPDGSIINVLVKNQVREYVSNSIDRPILCIDNTTGEPLDLSSSYREIIVDEDQIDAFTKNSIIRLSHTLNVYEKHDIEVVGIKEFTPLNPYGKTFKEYVLSDVPFHYLDIDTRKDIYKNSIHIPKDIREQYKYILVKYKTADKYYYRFTNWNRELFEPKKDTLKLKKPIIDTFNNATVIGTNEYPDIEYFFRVRRNHETTDFNMTVSNFSIINNEDFIVNYEKNQIELKKVDFKYYIVEYLKDNSYVINDLKYEGGDPLYEVMVSTNSEDFEIRYDQDKVTGKTLKYKVTDIPIKYNTYIALSNKE